MEIKEFRDMLELNTGDRFYLVDRSEVIEYKVLEVGSKKYRGKEEDSVLVREVFGGLEGESFHITEYDFKGTVNDEDGKIFTNKVEAENAI